MDAQVLKPGATRTLHKRVSYKLDSAVMPFRGLCNSTRLTRFDPDSIDISDLITLDSLHEYAIVHKLRLRFQDDLIYTSVSSVLGIVQQSKHAYFAQHKRINA